MPRPIATGGGEKIAGFRTSLGEGWIKIRGVRGLQGHGEPRDTCELRLAGGLEVGSVP